ncbi:MAG TPA: FixH family protein, partial [Opitutaceae bacterium]|nr:FixH family protein [Opitutaceae bacterium]
GTPAALRVSAQFTPRRPVVGRNRVSLLLTDAAGRPVSVGQLEIEGDMNHPGMRPEFSQAREVAPGTYAATINFTMGGDWFLLLTGETSSGKPISARVDVTGVGSP